MVDDQKSLVNTAAGTELNLELQEQALKHQKEMKKIREDMEVAISEPSE